MDFFTVENLGTLAMLIFLQAVLGFDNLLYISIESKRVPEDKQSYVRKVGIALAIVLRIVLLFVVVLLFDSIKGKLPAIDIGFFTATFDFKSIIELVGGAFILYTAVKEISHMLVIKEIGSHEHVKTRSVGSAIFWIVIMNLVFSFDSILSAIALTKTTSTIAVAIVISGLMMIFLADKVSDFLKKNRLYEILGLFILFIVGIMLVTEGGHNAQITLMGHHIEAMSKSTFYFVIIVLVLVDVAQSRYQKKIDLERGHSTEPAEN